MQTPIQLLFLLTLLLNSFRLFAQNGPPTIEQVRSALNRGIEQVKTPPVNVFKTEIRKVWSGSDSIPIQIYYPSANRNLPIVYNVHGGAFVMRALDVNVARILCNRTGSIVVCVDYRVAPEHPFPASINDSYAVWNWITKNAERIGGDRQKVSLIGDSAGGVFIGALQVKRQQEGRPERPLSMVYINPGVDLRPTAAGADEYRLVTDWYLNGADPNNPLVSPILNDKLSEYPPTLIITSETDEIRQHGVLLTEKLTKAGVPVKFIDLPGVGHLAGDWGAASPKAQPAVDATVDFLNSANAKTDK